MNDEQDRGRGWILTFTRRKFWPLDPRSEDFVIEDIAHALARICRFGGHVAVEHYSVAQHCVIMARQFEDPAKAYAALMHDASEAYPPGDILRPLKHSDDPGVAYLRRVQDRIDAVLRQRFALPQVDPAFVKEMDVRMLVTESRDIRGGWHPDEKYQPPTWQPLDERIVAWSATKSEEQFMLAFVDLQQQMRPGPAIPYMPIHFDVEGKK